jgi:hypothetical protein
MGECDIVANERAINKKIKCNKCGFTNNVEKKQPEIVVLKKRLIQ